MFLTLDSRQKTTSKSRNQEKENILKTFWFKKFNVKGKVEEFVLLVEITLNTRIYNHHDNGKYLRTNMESYIEAVLMKCYCVMQPNINIIIPLSERSRD